MITVLSFIIFHGILLMWCIELSFQLLSPIKMPFILWFIVNIILSIHLYLCFIELMLSCCVFALRIRLGCIMIYIYFVIYNDMDARIILAFCNCNWAITFILILWIQTGYGCCLYSAILFAICCRFFLHISPIAPMASITIGSNVGTLGVFVEFLLFLHLCYILLLLRCSSSVWFTVDIANGDVHICWFSG